MRSSILVVTQPALVVVGRSFGTADRSDSQGQAALTLADGTDKLSRNVGNIYQHTLRNNPEEEKLYLAAEA
jgi:hypothetical protein